MWVRKCPRLVSISPSLVYPVFGNKATLFLAPPRTLVPRLFATHRRASRGVSRGWRMRGSVTNPYPARTGGETTGVVVGFFGGGNSPGRHGERCLSPNDDDASATETRDLTVHLSTPAAPGEPRALCNAGEDRTPPLSPLSLTQRGGETAFLFRILFLRRYALSISFCNTPAG